MTVEEGRKNLYLFAHRGSNSSRNGGGSVLFFLCKNDDINIHTLLKHGGRWVHDKKREALTKALLLFDMAAKRHLVGGGGTRKQS